MTFAMTYDPLVPLKRELDRMAKGGRVAKAEILNLFRLIRLTLDAKNLRTSFPRCAMYCDWLQHTELDRNPGVMPLIEAIDSIFCAPPDKAGVDMAIKEILDALGLVSLRQKLVDLFDLFSLPASLLTGRFNWYAAVAVLIEDLVGRPLLFTMPPTTKAGKDVLARMVARRRAAGVREDRHVYKVVISDERARTPAEGMPAGFYFTIFISPGEPDRIQFTGHWSAQESRDAFSYD